MKKAIIGAGGHAMEVMVQMNEKLPCFVSDEYVDSNTLPLSNFNPNEYEVIVAIGDSNLRKKVVSTLPKKTKYFTFIHNYAFVGDNVLIGEGSFIGVNSIVTNNVSIGKHTILNRGNHIGHDTILGDYVSLMPGSIVSGNCLLRNCIYIGTNASIREKLTICDNVIIGLNCGVVKDITEMGTYVGLPAKKIKL